MSASPDTPATVVPEANLVPVSDHLQRMADIPPSRMFLINKSLETYTERNPQGKTFDASQGDGGASLPGVPVEILERAARLQVEHGTAYDMPYGTDAYRRCVLDKYWQINPGLGLGPGNVLGTAGGRPARSQRTAGAAQAAATRSHSALERATQSSMARPAK